MNPAYVIIYNFMLSSNPKEAYFQNCREAWAVIDPMAVCEVA